MSLNRMRAGEAELGMVPPTERIVPNVAMILDMSDRSQGGSEPSQSRDHGRVERDFDAGPSAMSWASESAEQEVGIGPHPQPWPDDPRLDPELLANGDRRNVVDHYRYWSRDAIVADLDPQRHPFHVAIENWAHDLNIGTIVRCANAFLAAEVHIVGRRRWNRRGAMVTDRYQHVRHHDTIAELVEWCREHDLPLIGIDNIPGSVSMTDYDIPRACMLLFGQEGPGLSETASEACSAVLHIPQFGSTRSINAGVAGGIAMYEWIRRHGETP
jgi:tRNA(Leu) C34 or U34 (ribose-2'-O)-methylase TrmL